MSVCVCVCVCVCSKQKFYHKVLCVNQSEMTSCASDDKTPFLSMSLSESLFYAHEF